MANANSLIEGLRFRPPAVDFIDNRLPGIHPNFANPPTRFDQASGRYVEISQAGSMNSSHPQPRPEPHIGAGSINQSDGRPETLSIKPPRNIFPEMMQNFKSQYPEEPKGRVDKGYSIRHRTSWGEVLNDLSSARDSYYNRPGIVGSLKKAGRKISENTHQVRTLAEFIPSHTFTSPVVTLLKVIIDAVKRTSTVRQDLEHALEGLSESFVDIEVYLIVFSEVQSISDAAINLGVSILKSIEEVIGYYIQHIVIKGLNAVWRGDDYQKSLTESLEGIKRNGDLLKHQAFNAHIREGHATYNVAGEIMETVSKTSTDVSKIESTMSNMQNKFVDMFNDLQRERDKQIAEENRRWKEKRAEEEALRRENASLQVAVMYYRAITPPPQPPRPPVPYISQRDLYRVLNVPELEKMDLEYAIQSKELLTAADQERAEFIMGSPKFRNWLIATSSTELLVHGNSDPMLVSPLSFFCSMLVQNLYRMPRFRTVVFFCGLHTASNDIYAGGRGMIKSFLTQLLAQETFNLNFLDPDFVARIKKDDANALCKLFGVLARQLSRDVSLFCIIDGVNFYDHGKHLIGMSFVLRSLLDLRSEGNMQTVFKILITSPSTTTQVVQAFDEENIWSLPSQQGTGQDFSQLRFERQMDDNFIRSSDR